MKKFNLIALLAIIIASITLSAQAEEDDNEAVYSQHGFYAEKDVNFTTNYAAGTCYPVNKKFEIIDIGKSTIELKDPESEVEILIKNAEKHSKKSTIAIKNQMFGDKEVNLSKHSAKVQAAIKDCKIIVGMTKEEVLLARGYPPAHQTPSTDANTWKYWYKRMSQGTVNFENGKVVSISGHVQP